MVEGVKGWWWRRRGVRKEKFPLLLSEWILQLSSGECAGIPQRLLLLKNAVIPNGAAHTHTYTHIHTPSLSPPIPTLYSTFYFNNEYDGCDWIQDIKEPQCHRLEGLISTL